MREALVDSEELSQSVRYGLKSTVQKIFYKPFIRR